MNNSDSPGVTMNPDVPYEAWACGDFSSLPGHATIGSLRGDMIEAVDALAVRVVRELGTLSCADYMSGDFVPTYRIGGGTVTRVRLKSGIVGYGPAVDPAVLPALAAEIVGKDPCDVHALAANLRRPPYKTGGVEIAIWDALGKLAGLPLYRLWGGDCPELHPYASQMTRGSVDTIGERASAIVVEGWQALKLRTSFATFQEDVAAVEAVRRAVGPHVTILADGNKAGPYRAGLAGEAFPLFMWDLPRAIDTAQAFAALGVGWLEEPLGRHDYEGMARLREVAGLPLSGGENHSTVDEFRRLAEGRCLDVFNPELTLVGPSLFLQAGAIARRHGMRCVGHVGHGGLGSICTWHLNAAWEARNRTEIIHEPPVADYRHALGILQQPPRLEADGSIRLGEAPGLGWEPDPELLMGREGAVGQRALKLVQPRMKTA